MDTLSNHISLDGYEEGANISSLFGHNIYRGGKFVSEKAVQRCLAKLNNSGESYEAIALRPEFCPIPFGTLRDIRVTGKVPDKWKDRLIEKRCYPPRIAIRKDDVESAARTILVHLGPVKAFNLIHHLQLQMNDQLDYSWLQGEHDA